MWRYLAKRADPERAGQAKQRTDGRSASSASTRRSATLIITDFPAALSFPVAPFRRSDGAWPIPTKEPHTVQSFSELELIEPIQRAVRAENYTVPTPIQALSI